MLKKIVCVLFLLPVTGLGLLTGGAGCATTSGPAVPVGTVKISYFSQSKALRSRKLVGAYIAVISKKWYGYNKKRLYEVFEKVATPKIHLTTDKQMDELVTYLQKKGFYRLKPIRLDQLRPEDLTNRNFQPKVITLEINGISRSVLLEDLRPAEQKIFREIRTKIAEVFNVSWPTATVTLDQLSPNAPAPPPLKRNKPR